jgi:hypothetical protein
MVIISLGGIGGCDLAESLRNLKQLTHPYDWLITTQSFILNSFNDFNKFFSFDQKYVYNKNNLLTAGKNAIMLHDFHNFSLEKKDIIAKYQRRFERLNDTLNSNDHILFVRIYDNLSEELFPINYYDNILIREEEDMEKWEEFISHTQKKYNNKNIKLLMITSREEICNKKYNNIILYFTKEHQNNKVISNIIQDTMKSAFQM